VWRATDANLDRDVALKVLPAALASDEQYMVRFHCEAKVLASLNHPNIQEANLMGINYAVSGDGQRFLITVAARFGVPLRSDFRDLPAFQRINHFYVAHPIRRQSTTRAYYHAH
jgi:serine/threonine protein kinase